MRILLSLFFLIGFPFLLQAQEGEWKGFIIQDGVQYNIEVIFEKEGKEMIGYTTVVMGDSICGGKIFGQIYGDRSMSLWDHIEKPQILPDSLPTTMRRRYQLLYRRSTWGDTIKGHWQQVHKGLNDFYKKGWIELKRYKPNTKA